MIRAVLIDLDDTLVDHQHAMRTALSGLHRDDARLRPLEFEFLLAEWQRLLETMHEDVALGRIPVHESRVIRYRRFYQLAGCEVEHSEVEKIAERHVASYLASRRIVPGAVALIEHLAKRAQIAVITNNTVREQEEKLATFGFDPHIDALITSEECGVAKPDGAIFRCALERLGIDADEAVMVGDSWANDVIGATQLGIRAVWLNRFGTPCPDPSLAIELDSLEPLEHVAALVLNGAR